MRQPFTFLLKLRANSATWAPIDVTGASVKLRLRELGSTTVKSTLACTVTSGTGGTVATDFPTGTLDTAGTFEGEIEITFSAGGIQTVYDLIKLKVRSDFDGCLKSRLLTLRLMRLLLIH